MTFYGGGQIFLLPLYQRLKTSHPLLRYIFNSISCLFNTFLSQQKGNFVNVVRKAQAAAWEEKFMAMKAKQKESNKVSA